MKPPLAFPRGLLLKSPNPGAAVAMALEVLRHTEHAKDELEKMNREAKRIEKTFFIVKFPFVKTF